MGYPAFLAEVALPENRKNLHFSIVSGYGTALVFGLLAAASHAFHLLPFAWPLYVVVALKLLTNTLAYVGLRRSTLVLETSGLNVGADLLAMTAGVYFTGGPESPLFAIYGIEISVVALLANRGTTYLVGGLAVVLYATMVILVWTGVLPALPTPAKVAGEIHFGYILMLLLLVAVVLGTPTFYTATIVGELREKGRALEERNRQLVEAGRHKSQFMANVTHELRTPIHGICGLSDLVSAGIYGPVTDKQKEAQQGIKRSAKSLLALIDDLLELSRADAGKMSYSPSDVDLGELLPSVLANVRWMQGTRAHKLTMEVEPDMGTVFTDRGKLNQVLLNLLANAMKFTPDGGEIRLRARRGEGDTLQFLVEDTGVGIPAAEQSRIFEAFHQVDATAEREYGGAGLGLSLVKRLLDMMGGDIRVTSEVGKGSTFTVTLPRRHEGA